METAREYLAEVQRLNARISNLADTISGLRDFARRVSPGAGSGSAKAKGAGDRLSGIVAKIADAEREMLEAMRQAKQKKQDVIALLEKMPNARHYSILYKRYLLGWSMERIADSLGCTPRGARYLHNRALEELEKIMSEN